jgi:hypothetical protein
MSIVTWFVLLFFLTFFMHLPIWALLMLALVPALGRSVTNKRIPGSRSDLILHALLAENFASLPKIPASLSWATILKWSYKCGYV